MVLWRIVLVKFEAEGKIFEITSNSERSEQFFDKVHIFWEGHKILQNLHLTFDYLQYIQSKVRWRFRKILWPSQNTWTLTVPLVYLNSSIWNSTGNIFFCFGTCKQEFTNTHKYKLNFNLKIELRIERNINDLDLLV